MTPASPWIGSISTAAVFGVMAARTASRSPYGHRDEARGEGAVVVVGDRVVGERDDGGGAAVEVAGGDDDLGAVERDALDLVRPLAGDLDGRLDGFGAGVHRQHHLGAGQLGEVMAERAELVVVERARGERQAVELARARPEQRGVPVAEVQRRVAGQEVEIALAVDVGDPGALGRGDHDGSGW